MSRAHRVIRAWAVALTAVGLGSASHGMAGGHLPHPLILALATALAAFLTLGITQLKLPRLSLGAGVFTGQGLLHTLYDHGATTLHASHSTGHHAHHLTVVAGQQQSYGADMWAGHALAAGATYTVLAYGEHLLEGLLNLVDAGARVLRLTLSLPPLPTSITVPARFTAPRQARSALLGRGRITRGPPAVLTFASFSRPNM